MVDDTDPADEPEIVSTPWHRRWSVRIGLGLFATFAVCTAVAPRYRIPSESMRPGVHAGDHVFTNPWVYWFGDVERGDVVLFRYPIDPSQLFFKRAMGLPGDEVTVDGHRVLIKRAGTDEVEELKQVLLDETCTEPDTHETIPNCALYEESLDGRSYMVRYRLQVHEIDQGPEPAQTWTVPEGHLFVLGDNRNDSLDSRRWTSRVEAVMADGLLSSRQLREQVPGRLFSMTRPDSFAEQTADPSYDHVIFTAHAPPATDDAPLDPAAKGDRPRLDLEVWLRPPEGLASRLDAARSEEPSLQAESSLPDAYAATVADAHVVIVPVESTQTLLRLRCETGLCPTRELAVALAERAAENALDLDGFVDAYAERPQPFVPMELVVARVERVIWPPSRFWHPVR